MERDSRHGTDLLGEEVNNEFIHIYPFHRNQWNVRYASTILIFCINKFSHTKLGRKQKSILRELLFPFNPVRCELQFAIGNDTMVKEMVTT